MDQLTSLMEWHRTGRLAPYVRATRSAGDAIGMIEAAQPAGDMSDPPTTDLTLIVSLSGDIRQSSNFGAGRFRDAAPRGAMFLIPPRVSAEIHVDNSHVIRCFAMSSLRYQPHLNELRGSISPFDFGRLHRGHFEAPQITNLLNRLWAVTESDSPAGRLFAEGVALSVLAELAMLADRPIEELTVGHLAPWQTSRITDYLESHIADDTSLSELASLVGLTHSISAVPSSCLRACLPIGGDRRGASSAHARCLRQPIFPLPKSPLPSDTLSRVRSPPLFARSMA